MKPIHPIAQTEMLVELVAARLVSEVFSIEQLLEFAGEAARWASRIPAIGALTTDPSREDKWPEIAALLANRASRLVPGAKCLHRALAGRVWLARRGIDSQIVVGFRKRGAIEGHAWLELQTAEGPQTLFKGTDDGYRESFREVAA